MKLLFITHKFYPDIGGIEVNSEILAKQFIKNGADVKLITWTQQQDPDNFPYPVIRNPSVTDLIALIKWSDVVYENNPVLKMSWPLLFFKKTHVIAVRTWIRRSNEKTSLLDHFKKKWLSKADAVIAISNAVRINSFKDAVVIGNPYRKNLFSINVNVKRNKDFVFLGRLVSDKGADMCIELLNYLNNTLSKNKSLTIIGDGPELENLKRMVKAYKLDNFVSFMGFLSGAPLTNLLNEHKYSLVPSRWEEPFGNVALEGLACGCIPIVSNGGGLPDAIGNAGVVFDRNSQNSMNIMVTNLIESKELQDNYLNQSKIHLQNHTDEVVGKRYFDVIVKAYK